MTIRTARTPAAQRTQVGALMLDVKRWPGSGTPILLLHEGLGSIGLWRDFPDRLAARTGRPVIAWSRQGYGWSDTLPEAWEPDYMHLEAERLPALLDTLGVDRAVLLGHSDGGSIALIFAALFPERVAGLILEAPHIHVEQATIDGVAAIGDAYRSSDLSAKLRRHHHDADHVFRRWNRVWLDPRFRTWTIEALLPRIAVPALLIQGLDDEYGLARQLRHIHAALARSRCLALGACGHAPHLDQPAAVLDAISEFLRAQSLD